MTPDPAGMAAADPANPQSWNRYAYVMNNPLNATDPLGLQSASQNDQCSPNSARPIGDGTARVPGLECGTGALDSSDLHSPKTPAPIVVPGQTITVTAEPSAVEILEAHESLFLQLVNGTWRPTSTTPIIPTGTISRPSLLNCASSKAEAMSLASKANLQGDTLMSKAGQMFLGNTFSGIYNFAQTARTATNAAPVYWALFTNGARLGLPGGGTISQGVLGKFQDTALKTAFRNLGKEGAQLAAETVGDIKILYDGVTFGIATAQCAF